MILSAVVFTWGLPRTRAFLDGISIVRLPVPGLHNLIQRVPPVVTASRPEAAVFNLNWLSATGSGILVAALVAGFVMGYRPRDMVRVYGSTLKLVRLSTHRAAMLALGFGALLGPRRTGAGVRAQAGSTVLRHALGWLGVQPPAPTPRQRAVGAAAI
jgi:lactate permease